MGHTDADNFAKLRDVRVALFTGNYNYVKEGANQALNKLVGHLEDRVGATVRVYSPVTDTPAFEPRGTLIPVASVPLPGRSEFRVGLGLGRAIRADIRAFAPDIVHVATPDILCTRAQSFAKTLGVPIVASVHTHFETYLAYYRLGFLKPLLEAHLDRFYRRSDMILAPGPAIVTAMGRRHGAEKMRLWARGVDTGLFAPERRSRDWRNAHGLGDDTVAAAFFGRIVLEKGIDTFAGAIAELRGRGLPVRAVVIGDGPARERMRAMLPDAVFTGHLTGEALATAIASCDMLLNPSVTETFGNVTLEAMASGLAVVAADAPSTANLIGHGVNGLVSPPDAAGFADHAARLASQPGLRALLAANARKTALDWNWHGILDSVLESYTILLRGQERVRSW